MSLATFKRKSINKYSTATTRSGKPPGGFWLPQGPFGLNNTLNSVMLEDNKSHYGPRGFSINGSRRSISVGADMKMSKSGTPYRGTHAIGWGGLRGTYVKAEPLLNMGNAKADVLGNQQWFVKPSVLSTRGMLRQKYRWAYSGKYPNYWVQPVYTGNQTDSASQGVYIHTKSAENAYWYDVNNKDMYENYYKTCNASCARTLTDFAVKQANAPYTKTLYIPKDSSTYTLYIQRKCVNPTGAQKPFPYAVPNGTGILTGGSTGITNVGNSSSNCGTSTDTNNATVPPAWYIATNGTCNR
jgi:hypothetical protein